MKKSFYIFCFIVLGVILQQIIHTVVEIWYIKLLIGNFEKYGFGWSWDTWFMIHHIGGALLFIAGAFWGYIMGRKCWVWVYVEKRHWLRKN